MEIKQPSQHLELTKINKKFASQKKNLIQKNEEELQKVKDDYETKQQLSKIQNDKRLDEMRVRQQNKALAEITEAQKRLDTTKKNIAKTEKIIQQQGLLNSEIAKGRIEKQKIMHEHELNRIFDKNQQEMLELNDKAQNDINVVHQQTKIALEDANTDANTKLNSQKIVHDSEVAFRQREFELNLNKKENQFMQQLAEKEIEHQNIINGQNKKHKKHLKDLNNQHMTEYQFTKEKYDSAMKEAKERFEAELKARTDAHQAAMSTFKDLSTREINALKLSNQKSKKVIDNKQQDSFYHLKELRPTVQNSEKHYFVSIPVAEHERDQVKLNIYQRELVLHLARIFKGKANAPDGTEFRTNRSETMSKKFYVPEIMNPRDVESKYENGVLTFKVAKL